MRIDPPLIARLERAYGASAAGYARRRAREDPSCGARALELRDGVVVVDSGMGGGENAHRAYGVGADDLDAVEHFYAARPGAGVHVAVTPPVTIGLHEALGGRGYVVSKQSSVLVASTQAAHGHANGDARGDDGRDDRAVRPLADVVACDVRPLGDDDIDAMLDVIDACYGPAPDGPDGRVVARARSRPLFRAPTTMFGAFVDGALAACGALVVEPSQRVGLLFAGMCHPMHRGRGLQSALIAARVVQAQAIGLELVTSLTEPLSTSECNLRRAGFTVVCTQSVHARRTEDARR